MQRLTLRSAWPAVVGAAILLGVYQFQNPVLLGNDSYFHAAAARSLPTDGFQRSGLRWLPLTRAGASWVDHEWGWHVLAWPFVRCHPVRGAQAFAVLQGLLLVLTVFALLRYWGAPLAAWLALASVAGSGALLYRGACFRPQTLALVLFLWAVWAIVERRTRALFWVTFALTAIHGSFVLVVGLALAVHLFVSVAHRISPQTFGSPHVLEPGAALLGALAGLTVNPYFPATFDFLLWHLSVAAGAPGGQEWQPYGTWELVETNGLVVALIGVVVTLLIIRPHLGCPSRPGSPRIDRQRAFVLLFLMFAAMLAAGTRSRRLVEYWVTLGVLWSGLGLAELGLDPDRLARAGQAVLGVVLGAVLGVSFAAYDHLSDQRGATDAVEPFVRLAGQLRERAHPLPGEPVYHSSWGHFPKLVFAAPELSYISGLDPAFLASRRPDLAALFEALGKGMVPGPALPIRLAFGARHAVVAESEPGLLLAARQDPLLDEIAADGGLSLFVLRAEPRLPLQLEGSWLAGGSRAEGGRLTVDGGLRFESGGQPSVLVVPVPIVREGPIALAVEADATPPSTPFAVSLNGSPVGMELTTSDLRAGVTLPACGRGLAHLALAPRTAGPVTLRLGRLRLSGALPAPPAGGR